MLLVLQGYVAHLADCEEIKGRLSKQDLNHLFGNIMHIYVFSRCVRPQRAQSSYWQRAAFLRESRSEEKNHSKIVGFAYITQWKFLKTYELS